MKRLLLSGTDAIASLIIQAPLPGCTRSFPMKNEAAPNLIITHDATKGNAGLATALYTVKGVIANLSSSSTHRKHAGEQTWEDAALDFQRKSLV